MTNLFPLDEATAQIMIPLPEGTVVELEDGILFRDDIDHKLIGAFEQHDQRVGVSQLTGRPCGR